MKQFFCFWFCRGHSTALSYISLHKTLQCLAHQLLSRVSTTRSRQVNLPFCEGCHMRQCDPVNTRRLEVVSKTSFWAQMRRPKHVSDWCYYETLKDVFLRRAWHVLKKTSLIRLWDVFLFTKFVFKTSLRRVLPKYFLEHETRFHFGFNKNSKTFLLLCIF